MLESTVEGFGKFEGPAAVLLISGSGGSAEFDEARARMHPSKIERVGVMMRESWIMGAILSCLEVECFLFFLSKLG